MEDPAHHEHEYEYDGLDISHDSITREVEKDASVTMIEVEPKESITET